MENKKEETEINYGWGNNTAKCFGSNTTTYINKPTPITVNDLKSGILLISGENGKTFFTTTEKKIYLIKATSQQVNLPDKNESVKNIVSGHYHSVILTESNKVYSFGSNSNYQLGHSYQSTRIDSPTYIDFFEKKGLLIKKIQCGYSQTYFLCENSHLYACGYNHNNQLGTQLQSNKSEIVYVTKDVLDIFSGNFAYYFFFLKEEGLFAVGDNHSGQCGLYVSDAKITIPRIVKLSPEFDITSLVCSYEHALLLGSGKNGQQLLSTGKTPQNGLASNITKFTQIDFWKDYEISQISVGAYHSMVLTEDSTVFCFGQNGYKQLGNDGGNDYNPYKIIIPEIGLQSNLEIYAGCYSSYLFHSDRFGNNFEKEFEDLFTNESNFSDYSIKEVKVHKIFLECRIGKPIKEIEQILNEYSKEQIITFIKWVYSSKIPTSEQQLINEICLKFGITNYKKKSLQNDLLKLWKDEDSKDFSIMVPLDDEEEEEYDDDEDEESYEEIPIHKFILIARSGLFRDMFNNITENGLSNSVKDYSRKTIESLEKIFSFFYTNTIELTADDDPELIIEELEDSIEYFQMNPKCSFNNELYKIKKKLKK
ncbi:btk-binding protein-related [Anaeramoeba flamelloides]|uniref:Btk-binding protein-related n=1 Tax=Anaeramoeba flamelloides TaxID=1746091 RepID=A0AAV7YG50_9EUKA|nr:btk-binding protein-related [Anaeramoeba flamelloides]